MLYEVNAGSAPRDARLSQCEPHVPIVVAQIQA